MKTNVNITLDAPLVAEARARNVRLSTVVNEFLRAHLAMTKDGTPNGNLDQELMVAEARYLELKTIKDIEVKKKKDQEAIEKKKQDELQHNIQLAANQSYHETSTVNY